MVQESVRRGRNLSLTPKKAIRNECVSKVTLKNTTTGEGKSSLALHKVPDSSPRVCSNVKPGPCPRELNSTQEDTMEAGGVGVGVER